ncbi:unnamed protein product, partial [Acidithrix sp. C25]
VLKISTRTFRRWESGVTDRRRGASHRRRFNALSEEEREKIIEVCTSSTYSSLTPAQIVPKLADQGRYIASERTFYRVLADNNLNKRRSRTKPPKKRSRPVHTARKPGDIWTLDITWLNGPARGIYYYAYVIIDLYSRKIVGWEVYESESSEQLKRVVKRAMARENMAPKVIHSDNGSPMKGWSLVEYLYELDVNISRSRPRVSNDNAHIESLFKTVKYFPSYPYGGFATIEESRKWMSEFVDHYNNDHQHSGIKFVTPQQAHSGEHIELLNRRREAVGGSSQIYTRTVDLGQM